MTVAWEAAAAIQEMRATLFILAIVINLNLSVGDLGDELGASDPYEQYAERLQQQLESLRKEHDDIFGLGDKNKDGSMSLEEFHLLHKEAEQGDERQKYDVSELEQGFQDLDKDRSAYISLDEWRRPFDEHTDSWLQMADTEAQQEAQIAHYKDVFNQMDFNGDSELDEAELQKEMENLHAQRKAAEMEDRSDDAALDGDRSFHDSDPMTQLSGEDMLLMMDSDRSGKVSFEEYLLGGEQADVDEQ